MKNWSVLAVILIAAAAALVVGERRKTEAPISPAPILYFVADTERELTRGPVSLTRISDSDEIAAGDEMARRYLIKHGEAPEQRTIASYIGGVGAKVAAHAHRKLPYQFHYLPDDNLVNAFALPGGHIFIGKGLLNLMETEDELANVLGHEIEHVELGHCAERVQIEAAAKRMPITTAVLGIPIEVFQAGYSKQQELDADREGTKLAVAAGYSPEGAISMFQRFQKLESQWQRYEARRRTQPSVLELPGDIANVVVLQTLGGYFRSHPPEEERIAQIRHLISAEHWSANQNQQALAIGYILRTDEASALLKRDEPDKAIGVVKEVLVTNSEYVPALNILGDANFERADFAAAADAYQKSLTVEPSQSEIASLYANSLAASQPAQLAARRYEDWLHSTHIATIDMDWFTVEDVGLQLLGGNAMPAKSFEQILGRSQNDDAPLLRARLGWWYYRSRDAQTAADLIGDVAEQRPNDGYLNTKLGWTLVAQKKYESAEKRFYTGETEVGSSGRAEAQMGLAVAAWEGKQPGLAVPNYRAAIRLRSAWSNPQWIAALYSQSVADSVKAIDAESRKQQRASAGSDQ